MQAKIERARILLGVLEQDCKSLVLTESEEKMSELMACLKSVFESKQTLSEVEHQSLTDLNERLIKLCALLEQEKKSSKDELSKIIKNKKKVGLYNQVKR